MNAHRYKGRLPKKSTFEFDSAVANGSADQGFHYRPDARAVSSFANVGPRKRTRVRLEEPEEANPYGDWVDTPAEDGEFSDIASTFCSNDTYEHFIEEGEVKRKRYTSSDDPMKLWRQDKHIFLDHLIRYNSLGDHYERPACSVCDAEYIRGSSMRLFRCEACGEFLQCMTCLEERHRLNPLHTIKEWNGDFWTSAALHKVHIRDQTAQSLNFVYQLGHRGKSCIRPASTASHTMVVIDVRGIFTLRVFFCGCEKALRQDPIAQLMANGWYPATTIDPATCATFACLEQFRMLNVVGNLSAHDYVGSLERLTDATLLGSTPDRYKAFGRMSRQFQFLKRAKRSGVGHDMARMENVKPGGLAVPCWACPAVGFNLPEGWETCKKEDEFLYSLMLALDANFRLKNRIRTNEKHDPSLGPGWGCFVDTEPYKEHLRDYVAEVDYLHRVCRADAEGDAFDDGTAGIWGWGLCFYANMDYILLHALGDTRVKRFVLSYDIACQWKQQLRTRVLEIANDAGLLPDLSNFEIVFGLPVWHAAAHEINCQAAMSLSYATGVGRTDGEGIERTWATLNPISYATKEMGEGNRHDSIEDKIDHISFEKNVGEGDTLGRKLVIAVAERDKQIREFIEIDRGLEPSLRKEWQKRVDDWVADPTKPNPYVMAGGKDAGPSEAQVAADLKKAEVEEAREGRGSFFEGRTTATSFIKGLLQLEDMKRRIKHEREQEVFMAGVTVLRAAEEERRDGELPAPKAEDVKLWLPSDLTDLQRSWVCKSALPEVEAKLREAQCGDALAKIRSHLYAKTHLIHTRNAMAVGQAASTRSSTLIQRVGDRLEREVTKYTQAWTALRRLKGKDYAPHLRELQRGDLHVRTETESDARARIRLGRLGESRRGRNEPTATTAAEGSKGVSWIWSAVREDDEVGLHEAVRVHWAKALARRDRWVEERQVAVHRQIADSFYRRWHVDSKAALKGVLGLDSELHRRVLHGEQVGEAEGSVVELEDPREQNEAGNGTGRDGSGYVER
ncbi:hypothetical protein C8F01DRAFT_1264808 [Mycena amicta]|nr:hypothetical protein C8F01DRAFT_1264808 [Mycena amicta]